MRKRQSKELVDHAKKCKATDVAVSGDFNENTKSDAMKRFVSETGLHDVFAETKGAEEDKREATHQHGSKCTDHV